MELDHLFSLVPRHVIQHIVALTPPSDRSGPNRLAWKWTSQSAFSTMEAFKQLCSSTTVNVGPWKVIWKACVPQRVQVFLWLLWHDKLLTNSVKRRRHMADDEFCLLCYSEMKTRFHMIRDYPFIRRVWQFVVPMQHQGAFFELAL